MALKPNDSGSRSTVLIGFAESLAAPECAWSLLEAGHRVHAFHRAGSRPPLRHCPEVELHTLPAPEGDVAEALRGLSEIIALVEPARVMPLDDAALWLLDRLSTDGRDAPGGRLEIPVAGPTGPTAALALDRASQITAAAAAGFEVPATATFETPAAALAESRDFPLVLRPAQAIAERRGRLLRRATRPCADSSELEAALSSFDAAEPVVTQPLIEGTGEGLFGLIGERGLIAASAHRRLRMMNPAGSGSSACVSRLPDRTAEAAAERMLVEAGWRGIFMVELMREPGGNVQFIELNGRAWGSMALARRLGFEYPAWAIEVAADPSFIPPKSAATPGVVCRHAGRDLVHLAQVMRGPRSQALAGQWPGRARSARDVLRVRRGEHLYNRRPGSGRLFWADTMATLRDALPGGSR